MTLGQSITITFFFCFEIERQRGFEIEEEKERIKEKMTGLKSTVRFILIVSIVACTRVIMIDNADLDEDGYVEVTISDKGYTAESCRQMREMWEI